MKVLFTTNLLSPYRVDFLNELGKFCELVVFDESDVIDAKQRNPEWFSNEYNNFSVINLKSLKVGKRRLYPSLTKYIKDNQFNVVVFGGYSTLTQIWGIYNMNKANIPCFINLDGAIYSSRKKAKNYLKKILFMGSSSFLVSGDYTAEYLKKFNVSSERIYTYPFTSVKQEDVPVRPINTLEKETVRKDFDIKEKNVIVTVGQFIHRKGFDVLLAAANSFEINTGVYIIGGTPTEEYLTIQKDNNLSNVHFIGFQKKEDVLKYFQSADVMVLPTREDIWGLVVNEAMAQGLPVITTDKCVAGLELITDDQNGYIVPVDDSAALAEKTMYILNNEPLKKQMGENNLLKMQDYTIENMAAAHMRIFEQFLH
ncbi:glycosyltransferase family 4 protein [Salisediminibacterium halotolerans]|uniref:glycosyltransferase family 4 protein n=1 Tax=Salisediminibacterium halotolerans TaxID=517425 RepID=UPI000F24C1DE|nr:glycosyltransferase family 4 protein [Salisediminibacterium halotolerans]RLJ75697.1 glycosyltransferase involved in cell wall biosynthesis [Actinophytocola xinjiangensis]RPE89551.1 glycosyltransferase involved in cell wall biosynthesis [Salisediminibacterium halotolerans]TWG36310.1 glycosyltransferase involved in cell wall biosynthesis [Salisediminibacterium halotolerans]GEL07242.1 1,2-diacylglycerol 3-glucosyltransferase [Salisediminibacterium halotolerans]